MAPEERAEYIFMDLINTPDSRGVLVRRGVQGDEGGVVSELGVYGVWLVMGRLRLLMRRVVI
jgi:hypothetical protein